MVGGGLSLSCWGAAAPGFPLDQKLGWAGHLAPLYPAIGVVLVHRDESDGCVGLRIGVLVILARSRSASWMTIFADWVASRAAFFAAASSGTRGRGLIEAGERVRYTVMESSASCDSAAAISKSRPDTCC